MSIIESMITAAKSDAEQRQAREQAAHQLAADDAQARMRSQLNDIWLELEPLIVKSKYDHIRHKLEVTFNGEPLRMLDFYCVLEGDQPVYIATARSDEGLYITCAERLAGIFQMLRDKYISNQMSTCESILRGINGDLPEAQAAFERLRVLQPDRDQYWRDLYDQWCAAYTMRTNEKRAYEAVKAQQMALLDEYLPHYAAYYQAYVDAYRHNSAICQRLEAELNAPLEYWLLTYGMLYWGEQDDERYVETRCVNVLSNHPNAEGMWPVAMADRPGGVSHVQYANQISVEGPLVDTNPAINITLSRYISSPDDRAELGLGFRVSLGVNDEHVQDAVRRADWVQYPDEPHTPPEIAFLPELLDAVGDIQNKIYYAQVGQDQV